MMLSLAPLRKDTDQARQARALRDKADNLLAMEADLAERERELRQRAARLDAREAALTQRARTQSDRESRALEDHVADTLRTGRALLLGNEDAGTELIPITSPRYDPSKTAAAIIQAGKVRRGERVSGQRAQKGADVLADAERIVSTPTVSRAYDPAKVAAAIIQAGKMRRGEL